MEGDRNYAASYLSSQKVHGECKGRVSFSLSLEILPKSVSLMWMLCSSRPGLDGVLSCNAATGTAIVMLPLKTEWLSKKKNKQTSRADDFTRAVIVIYIGRLSKTNPDQLLTHWSLHRFAPSQQQKKRWRPLTACGTYSAPELSRSFCHWGLLRL